jgi:pimeloyl-ACP methyl ester carboxylesterase
MIGAAAENSSEWSGSDPEVPVVCVHGLWMTGLEMKLLRRRLQRVHGRSTVQFSYPTVRGGIDDNCRRFAEFIAALPASRVDIIGHSLGGVLTLQTLSRFATQKVRRIVCLGSPLVDSSAARNLGRWGWGRALLGRTIKEAVLEQPLRSVGSDHEVGVVSGSVGLGLGVFVGKLQKPHDGMVTVSETRLPGITAHRILPVNHFGLILSRAVADQANHFLRHGEFD